MPEPIAERPGFVPGYGILPPDQGKGLMRWSDAVAKLQAARNYWVSTTRADGRPHVAPVWGVWLDGALLFGTDDRSVKGKNIARNPEVVVHLESGDDVVIIEGVATMVFDETTMRTYAEVYERKYAFRPEAAPGTAYAVRPRVAFSWTEQEFPGTATRFRFV